MSAVKPQLMRQTLRNKIIKKQGLKINKSIQSCGELGEKQ